MPGQPAADLTLLPSGARAVITLGHGAGSPMTSPLLEGFCDALAAHGIGTHRFNFPYMAAGRRAPDRAPVLIEAFRQAHARAAEHAGRLPLFAGGRSMGGRIASMAVADGMPAAGLLFLAYPLHPPGRPDQLRVDHFPALTVPCLFVSGTRDAFARPDELRDAVKAVAGPVTHVWIEGGDHGLRKRDAEVAEAVREWVLEVC